MTAIDFRGLTAATVVPMTPDQKPDEAALRPYIRWVAGQGVTALAINVDTGETAHLSPAERRRVLEIVREELPSGVGLVAGLGGPYTEAARRQAREYRAIGADALLVFPIPAYYSTPLDPEIPYRYHSAIAEAGVPMILFQLQPALGGAVIPRPVLERLLSIDGVVALKEASFDARTFMDTVEIVGEAAHDVVMLTGNDNFIFESLVLGAEGALLGFGTIMVREQVELIKLVAAGSLGEARMLGKRVQRLADIVFAPPVANYRARVKEVLALQGVIPSTQMREPLLSLREDERELIRTTLEDMDLLTAEGTVAGARP
ncbi:dihydrodipicolinate synthase family protein [Sinosporangium siamense]|uniref:Dihydrodipicolinate synthase family protein n=1 Tax=Sinosporangium siamense TaxID=1367973 RepID=A0A919RNN5_9ACTN|nr:dihydrodipicolinate synthase family protein [Sinosporangium siamense]GII95546.1 dihydrodipicolinate synthase family protein [Sinosporangium siamense]